MATRGYYSYRLIHPQHYRKKNRGAAKGLLARCVERDGNWCVYCSRPDPETVDHVVPRYAGGLDVLENTVAACSGCNQDKGDYSLLLWLLRDRKAAELELCIVGGATDEELMYYRPFLGPRRFARMMRHYGIKAWELQR